MGRRSGLKRLWALGMAGTVTAACGGTTDELPRRSGVDAPSGSYTLGIDQTRHGGHTQFDLLFVIDNSMSMADKQIILADSVPQLVKRLVDPLCFGSRGASDRIPGPGVGLPCPEGYQREFEAISDLHIGVISSSLGGHGADTCSPAGLAWTPDKDDRGHLLPSVRQALDSYQGLGFLAWDPRGRKRPPGENDFARLSDNVMAQIVAAGETGCGFEAQLESWYRFLIDPEPPARVVKDPANPSRAILDGIDEQLLQQRAGFLRPNSLVAVVMLSDENDCSIADDGTSWISAQAMAPDGTPELRMQRATAICDSDPNSPCCRSCGLEEAAAPSGCDPLSVDAECRKGVYDRAGDSLNLRCWDQKRRFGVDFLYPIERYVAGLIQQEIPNRAGEMLANPLYSDLMGSGAFVRDPSRVFLVGILGVPWQDLATEDTLTDPSRLDYLDSQLLGAQGRWEVILGDPARGVRPTDGLMWETHEDRTTLRAPPNPIIGAPLAPSTSTELTNPINGHEYSIPNADDLQYACIFSLDAPRDCSSSPPPIGCACADPSNNNPVCTGTLQTHAKAYPGLRQLQVLKGIDESGVQSSVVASICPKISDRNNPYFGYAPALDAITDSLKSAVEWRCFPQRLTADEAGHVDCIVLESNAAGCDCTRPGRGSASAAAVEVARALDERTGNCGGATGRPCADRCYCEIEQLSGPELRECQSNPETTASGYCYLDLSQGLGEESLLEHCPPFQKRLIRIVGDDTPPNGSLVMLACLDRSLAGLGAQRKLPFGAACVPSLEQDPSFAGFSAEQVSVEVGSVGCATGVCLVNHFNGRTSCPYGQTDRDVIDLDGDRCSVPGSDRLVEVPVDPQHRERRAKDTVHCSCRCAGPGAGPYCACPQGFECRELFENVGFENASGIVGSYCIKQGTAFGPSRFGTPCARDVRNCDP